MYRANTNKRDFLVVNFTNDTIYMDKNFNNIMT